MQKRNKKGMRNYVKENLAKGYTLKQINDTLTQYGYSEKKAGVIITDYEQYALRKGKLISNNILAVLVVLFMLSSVISNYYIMTRVSVPEIAAMATATAVLCVNNWPEINISGCETIINVSEAYYCNVTATDPNANTNFNYYDNTSLFDINLSTGEINFTPVFSDNGNHSINITVDDGSGCDNSWDSAILSLQIISDCTSKLPPVFNISNNYTIIRDIDWLFLINATDPEGDGITYNVEELDYDAFAEFNSIYGNSLQLDSASGLLNISSNIRHIGWHLLNISVKDNSSCPDNTTSKLVNITVDANNSAPFYIGLPAELDHSWDEDLGAQVVYDLDDYFNDSDKDCLTYRFELISCSMNSFDSACEGAHGTPNSIVKIDNLGDPRAACYSTHPVTLYAKPNSCGSFIGNFYANDTINESYPPVLAVFTINCLPEAIELPSDEGAGGAGAGMGGAAKIKRCEEKWYCGVWGECIDGFMLRECTDMNKCHTSRFKPNETAPCKYIEHCYDRIQNYGEEGIDCGGECDAECVTCYDAIMNCQTLANGTVLCEEGIDCGGLCRPCAEEEKVEITEEEKPAPIARVVFRYWLLILILILLLVLVWLIRRARKERKKKKKEIAKEERVAKKKGILKRIWQAMITSFKTRKRIRKAKHKIKPKKEHKEKEPGRVVAGIKRFISKIKQKEEEVKEEITGTALELSQLSNKVGKLSNVEIAKEIGIVIRRWLTDKFKLDYEPTYEELSSVLKEKKKQSIIKKIQPVFDLLTRIEYSEEETTQEQIRTLINTSLKIVGERRVEQTPKKRTKVTMVLFLVMVLLGSIFFMFRPEITGMLIGQVDENIIEIDKVFTGYSVYYLDVGEFSSIRLSGNLSRDAAARVYIGDRDDNYLVFDSSAIIKPRIKTDQIKEFKPDKKEIDLKIDYNKDTPWDEDNDGITHLEGVVDITIKNSKFNGEFDNSRLCTLWKIINDENIRPVCYGSYDCCSLLELIPERDRWDDTLYLNHGKYRAAQENLVSAQLIYANYSLDPENAYSEIIESETENISVSFLPGMIRFEDICIESCSISGLIDKKLIIEVSKGELYIEKLSYSKKEILLNTAPLFRPIPNITIEKNKEYTLNLNDYASDADNDELLFAAYGLDNLGININNGIAAIVPEKDWEGKVYIFFTANDSKAVAISNIIEINVKEILEQTLQGRAKIGEPVKWTKKVKFPSSEISLEHTPINISVKKKIAGSLVEIPPNKIKIRKGGKILEKAEYESQRKKKDENISVIIEEQAEEYEIQYYTAPPGVIEQNISAYKKRIIVSSDIHYTDITAFTGIDEKPIDSIKLYHIVDGSRETTQFESYDRNNNGLIDYIEWIIPHLSNETYEVEIIVLNVQSYPMVGGQWEVRFTTSGKANLSISAINETSYGETPPDDLAPLELRCGNTVLEYVWEGSNNIYYYDYECAQTGYWTVTVLTGGIHNQKFEFGGAEAFADNKAGINETGTNLTIWDDTDTNDQLKSTDMIVFYANYTNMSTGTVANGTCTIKFNFTGSWQDETNMTYTSPNLPWNYSRTIPYKGATYFNVRCENNSMAALNVTDEISIINSKPVINDTEGRLDTFAILEDTVYDYNFSKNVTDPNLNDALSYGYKMPHPFPNDGVFSMNYTTGIITFMPDNNNEAGSYDFILIAEDSEASSSTILPVNITAVNDAPLITQPPGNTLTDATSETYYWYDVNATDEEDSEGSGLKFNLTFISCQRPAGGACSNLNITFNTTTGLIAGTPTQNDPGNYTFNISVTDSGLSGVDNKTDWKLVNLTVIDINNPPVFDFVCNNSRSAIEDIPFSCTLNATDPDVGDDLTFSANVTWFNNSIYNTGLKNATVNLTPLNEHVGNHTILLTVTDGLTQDTAIIEFTVNNTNDAPWLYNISNQIAVIGLEFRYNITAYDDDFWQPGNSYHSESENLSFSTNSTFFNATKISDTKALINFTPVLGQEGNYAIFVNVSDLAANVSNITFNLTIRNNTAPGFDWICNNSRLIQENVSGACYVNATDLEGDNFTFSINVSSWFTINATTGNVSFRANDTEVGNHTINFTVTDYWGLASSKLLEFSVNNTPEPPYFYGLINMTAVQDTLFTYNLSSNASDEDMNTPQGDTIYYYDNATFFEINLTTGLINFTPNAGDVGSYVINFTINDSFNLTASILVNFTVLDINDPPQLDYVCDNERTAVEDILFNCTINATDIDGDNLTFSANASWFNLTNISGYEALANFTPLNAQVGTHVINISVTDGQLTDSLLINFTVNNTNDEPYFNPVIPNLNATEDSPFSFDVNASDDDLSTPVGDVLIFSINSTLFIINASTGFINFTPNASQVGNYSIRFNVTDLAGAFNETVINFTILEFNDPPVLPLIPNFTLSEGDYFYYDINATDEEDGNDTSGLLRYSWNHTRGWFELNATAGVINFTANSTMIGTHMINLTLNDSGGKQDWQVFKIEILEQNSAPNITMIMPYGTPLSASTVFAFANRTDFPDNITSITLDENTTVIFNHTTTDANVGDTLTSKWYKNAGLVYTTTNNSYTYILDFYEAGQYNITLVVDDGRGKNDTFAWNITVSNINRGPTFGLRGHSIYSDLRDGSFTGTENNTDNTAAGIILALNSSGYYTYGEFISTAIDINAYASSFYNPIGFTNISWTAITPAGTNVTVQTRTSHNGINWYNWSIMIINRSYTSSTGEPIVSENATYIQYKLILQTNNINVTPNVTSIRIEHILPDLTMDEGDTNPGWIDLDNFFYDLDTDDSLLFTVSNASYVDLSLNNITNIVSITALSAGTEIIYFTASDSYGNVWSNNITIIVEPVEIISAVEYIYISTTRIVVRTRTRTVTEPRYLELLSPRHITTFSDDTVVAPIVLRNNGEAILNGIEMTAEATSDLVEIWFSEDSFDSIAPDQTEETNMFIRWEGIIAEFDIIVNATSTDPEYHDTVIISATGLTRIESNRSVTEEHIKFVRDLLESNPECLELTELLEEAVRSFEAGDYTKTRNSLNFVIGGCRYLITAKKEIEQPTPIKQREDSLFKLISGILLLLLLMAVMIIIATRRAKRS